MRNDLKENHKAEVKPNSKIFNKQKEVTFKRTRHGDISSNEIALRDEILELKRQVMVLKRTNQQNLIKFRKYENEVKRKDRQIETLLDPHKICKLTRMMTTEGMAILMDLKDRNDFLSQTILTKDLQIRKLIAELKTSKLYSTSRKTDNQKSEVLRLRNFFNKSQETLKETNDFQQQQDQLQNKNRNLIVEMSTGSNGSSPKDFEEMHQKIQSLEAYIKFSRDLLIKKNQEIMNLSEELVTLKKKYQFDADKNYLSTEDDSTCNHSSQRAQDFLNSNDREKIATENILNNLENMNIIDLFQKTMMNSGQSQNDSTRSESPAYMRFSDLEDNVFTPTRMKKNKMKNMHETAMEITENGEELQSLDLNNMGKEILDDISNKMNSQQTYTIRKSANRKASINASKKKSQKTGKKLKQKWKLSARNVTKRKLKCAAGRFQFKREKKSGKGNHVIKFNASNENLDFKIQKFENLQKKIGINKNAKKNKIKKLKCFDKEIAEKKMEKKEKGVENYNSDGRGNQKTEMLNSNECLISAKGNSEEKFKTANSVCINIECGEGNNRELSSPEFSHVTRQSFYASNAEDSLNSSVENRDVSNLKKTCNNDDSLVFCNTVESIEKKASKSKSQNVPEILQKPQEARGNLTAVDETKKTNQKIQKDSDEIAFWRRSYNSTIDSDDDYPCKQEVQVFQVKVEINSTPDKIENSGGKLENDLEEKLLMDGEKYQTRNVDKNNFEENLTKEKKKANINVCHLIHASEDDDDDDDIVIKREIRVLM